MKELTGHLGGTHVIPTVSQAEPALGLSHLLVTVNKERHCCWKGKTAGIRKPMFSLPQILLSGLRQHWACQGRTKSETCLAGLQFEKGCVLYYFTRLPSAVPRLGWRKSVEMDSFRVLKAGLSKGSARVKLPVKPLGVLHCFFQPLTAPRYSSVWVCPADVSLHFTQPVFPHIPRNSCHCESGSTLVLSCVTWLHLQGQYFQISISKFTGTNG